MQGNALAKRGDTGQSQPFWISAVASIAILVAVIVLTILIHKCVKAKRRRRQQQQHHTLALDRASQVNSSSNLANAGHPHDSAGSVNGNSDEELGIQQVSDDDNSGGGAVCQEKVSAVTPTPPPSPPPLHHPPAIKQKTHFRLSRLLLLQSPLENSIAQQPNTTTLENEKTSSLANPQQNQTPPAMHDQSNDATTAAHHPSRTADPLQEEAVDHHPSNLASCSSARQTKKKRKGSNANNNGTWTSNVFASIGRKSVASVQWVGFRGSMDHRPQSEQLFVVNQDDVRAKP